MQANYHTHTRWCKHGTGEIEDYIEEAIRKGLTEIAITEHVPHKDTLIQGEYSGRNSLPMIRR